MPAQPAYLLSETEYLQHERQAEFKSEYLNGEVYTMAGASREHNQISTNLVVSLGAQLLEKPCGVYSSDMKVRTRTDKTNKFSYPDVVVTCGDEQFEDENGDVLLNPLVIIEVLSASTEAYDRGDKFAAYRRFPGLTTVLFLSQDRAHVECFTRGEDGRWILSEASGDTARLALPALGFELALADLYRDLPDSTPEPAATAN